jgi:ubiquinone/menaquinone biosynthesis C-methylase UbiE
MQWPDWDKDKIHMERSVAIASDIKQMIPLNPSMKALEYGAGTGILSFLLKDRFSEIILMDNSMEMIRVCEEKAAFYHTSHIKPIRFDLEHADFDRKFDVIYSQMVMHHVNDVESMFNKFYLLLNPGGYLAIADLYVEDGSFHGPDADVHKGFDPELMAEILKCMGFKNPQYKTSFEIKREDKTYPVFLLTAMK